jgi:hypothetical protein
MTSFSQTFDFQKYVYAWAENKPDVSNASTSFSKEDAIVLDEKIQFDFTDLMSQTLTKTCLVKINKPAGIKKAAVVTLPESFDIAVDKYFIQQGRGVGSEVPFIYKYKILYYKARVLKRDGKVIEIPAELRTDKFYWIDNEGLRMEDYVYHFLNNGLEVGDILEYTYKAQFQGKYGYNLFYFSDEISKQNISMEVKYHPLPQFEKYDIISSPNCPDSLIKKTSVYDPVKSKKTWTYTYKFEDLPSINYPLNTRCGKQLPHIFVDFDFVSYYTSGMAFETLLHADRGPNFEWIFAPKNDSLGYKEAVYDKQHAGVRKFISKVQQANPPEMFYTALCDSLNALKFISAESMKYGQNAQYSVSSGEWLTKGKLIEEFVFELYWEILNELKKPTYFVTVQDKRLGELKFDSRTEYRYEYLILGVPNGKSSRLIRQRNDGLKFNADELPFYMQGVNAALRAANYHIFEISSYTKATDFLSVAKVINFIKTPASTENENVRTENGVITINPDSSIMHLSIKENLNGQFSTILRPFYLKESIDSTISPTYFKRCIDKPGAVRITNKLVYKSNVFPFKNSFACTEDIPMNNSKAISLKDWFAFTYKPEMINGDPNFDYYTDFRYSDAYNYLLKFAKPVEIENLADFTHSLNNKYFEISSGMVKQDESNYLLSVTVKVKQELLPKEEGNLLLAFINELNQINNATVKLK